jgi:hypothetical protein
MTREPERHLRASATGSIAESTIRAVLIGRGYVELRHEELRANRPPVEQTAMFRPTPGYPERLFVAQYPIARSVYDLPLFADFWLDGAPSFPNGLAIEVKWQQSSGSVDEKFPYLVLNIKTRYPCPAIVIADGGGQRPGALNWLREQVDNQSLLAVASLAEFLAWANKRL